MFFPHIFLHCRFFSQNKKTEQCRKICRKNTNPKDFGRKILMKKILGRASIFFILSSPHSSKIPLILSLILYRFVDVHCFKRLFAGSTQFSAFLFSLFDCSHFILACHFFLFFYRHDGIERTIIIYIGYYEGR